MRKKIKTTFAATKHVFRTLNASQMVGSWTSLSSWMPRRK